MTKVYIDPGHGGSDPGAVKYLVERDVNLVMAKACRDYLEANGVTTKMSRTSNSTGTSINSMAASANSWGADIVISIHNNAGDGDGFEVYYSVNGGTGKKLAKNIEAEVKKIGQNSRGIKTKKNSSGTDYFGMIRLTNAPAVICEGVFVDNKTDYKIADTTAEQKKFGYAYAKGILKTLGLKDKGYSGGGSSNSSSESSSSNSSSSSVKDYPTGINYVITASAGLKVRTGPGTNYAWKNKSQLTTDGKKHASSATSKAVLVKGTVVTCYSVKTSGNYIWMQIPSGWICAEESGVVYVSKTGSSPSSSSSSSSATGYRVGRNYTIVTASGIKVRTGPGTNYSWKKRSQLTTDGKKHAASGTYAVLVKGTTVTCMSVKTSGGYTWLQIPSGWVCAVENGSVYIK